MFASSPDTDNKAGPKEESLWGLTNPYLSDEVISVLTNLQQQLPTDNSAAVPCYKLKTIYTYLYLEGG